LLSAIAFPETDIYSYAVLHKAYLNNQASLVAIDTNHCQIPNLYKFGESLNILGLQASAAHQHY
jgi:hypothetical protein